MGQGQVRVTPEQLQSRAGEYRTQAEAVDNVITQMNGLINALEAEWEGKSAQKYISQYNELKPSFTNMYQLICDLAEALDAQAKKFEQADNG